MTNLDFNAVVIGSGAGGLTAALCLAQAGLTVLVCEQHEVPGGWCHSFTMEGYKFSPGVHYIGRLGPGESMRKIYEGLDVSQDLAFCEINPDGYDHVLVGRQRFDIPKGRQRYANRLKRRFPQEAEGIDQFLDVVTDMNQELRTLARGRSGVLRAPFVAPTLLRWGRRSAQTLIDHCVSDPLLKAILSAQAGDHGLPPSMVPAVIHCGIADHYMKGAYYPLGGAFSIPRSFTRALKRAGGQLLLKTSVERILLEGGRAIGVKLADGTEIRAGTVISNADPEMTFGRLIGRENLGFRLRRRLDRLRYSVSALSLFLASNMDLRAAGLDSGNVWYYQNADVDAIYRQGMEGSTMDMDRLPALFLTATTLKDPSKMHSGHHTLEAFTFVPYDPFEPWAGDSEGQRSVDYLALKERLAKAMLNTIEEIVPGFRDSLVFCELGTPLTNAHYLRGHRGNLYGIEKSLRQIGPFAFPVRSSIDGLWLAGASTTGGHGVSGATGSGLAVARGILGVQKAELLTANGPELQIYPSEEPSLWPENLMRKTK